MPIWQFTVAHYFVSFLQLKLSEEKGYFMLLFVLLSLCFVVNSVQWIIYFHRAVSSTTALLSYSHTVLSRFIINGISTSSSERPPHILARGLGPRLCIAIVEGGGGCVPLIVIVCDIFLTPAIVPPYDGQWLLWWRGNVHVFEGFWNCFGTPPLIPLIDILLAGLRWDWPWRDPLRSVQ